MTHPPVYETMFHIQIASFDLLESIKGSQRDRDVRGHYSGLSRFADNTNHLEGRPRTPNRRAVWPRILSATSAVDAKTVIWRAMRTILPVVFLVYAFQSQQGPGPSRCRIRRPRATFFIDYMSHTEHYGNSWYACTHASAA